MLRARARACVVLVIEMSRKGKKPLRTIRRRVASTNTIGNRDQFEKDYRLDPKQRPAMLHPDYQSNLIKILEPGQPIVEDRADVSSRFRGSHHACTEVAASISAPGPDS